MKKFITIAALLICTIAAAQNKELVYSITACPSEDVSTSMNISWAADTTAQSTYVLVTKASDRKWRKARKVYPEQQELCTVFDGIYSKKASNEDFYEDARFLKCGAHIDGLMPDTDYKYVICIDRKTRLCDEHHFKTAGAQEWSCCIISDFHSYPPLGKRLDAGMDMVETVKAYDPSIDWILTPGDVCAWGGSYSFWKTLYSRQQYADFFWGGVNGNHDNMTRKSQLTNEFFKNTAYYPRNGYEGEMGVCYHFRYGEALFMMLNNEDMRTEEGLLAAQRWFKKVVLEQKASANPPLYIIAVEHYQWFMGDTGKDAQYGRWCDLFDELGVDLAIAGNDHVYNRTGSVFAGKKTDGSYGTVYMNTSSSDNERGRTMKELEANKELVEHRFTEGPKTISALDMKVNSERIELTLLDRNGNVLDQAVVKAKKNKPSREDVRGNYMRDSLEVFTARCQKVINAAYMAEKFIKVNDSIPGWEGFPVELWEYYTPKDAVAGVPKKGLVYMLNPDASKLAHWIINAVYDATGKLRYDDLEKVRKYIMWQSGAQFPVSGVVYEDMEGKGEYYPYLFKDGVTVYLEDEATWKSIHPSDEQLQFYLTMTNDDLKSYTGRFGRICSTTRKMYTEAGGAGEVGDDAVRELRSKKWLDAMAKTYQKAWKSSRNFLIYAWCKANLENAE